MTTGAGEERTVPFQRQRSPQASPTAIAEHGRGGSERTSRQSLEFMRLCRDSKYKARRENRMIGAFGNNFRVGIKVGVRSSASMVGGP